MHSWKEIVASKESQVAKSKDDKVTVSAMHEVTISSQRIMLRVHTANDETLHFSSIEDLVAAIMLKYFFNWILSLSP